MKTKYIFHQDLLKHIVSATPKSYIQHIIYHCCETLSCLHSTYLLTTQFSSYCWKEQGLGQEERFGFFSDSV